MQADREPDLTDYADMLRPYIRRQVPADLVEDVLQETMLRLHQRSPREEIANFRAYAFQSVRSVIIDLRRRDTARHRSAHSSLEEGHHPSHSLTPERVLIGQEALDRFVVALEEMPVRTRDIFVLHRFEDMSYAAIADHMEISLSAVGKHMMKALYFLAERDLP